jgi:hypothetical protein
MKKAGCLILQAAGRSFGLGRVHAGQNCLDPSGARSDFSFRQSLFGAPARELPTPAVLGWNIAGLSLSLVDAAGC